MLKFCRKLPKCLLKWLYHFPFVPTINESSSCLAFLPEIAIVSFLDCSHSNRCIVVSSCFNLHFSNDKLCWASFHMLPCHLCIFFGEACPDLFPIFKLVCLFSCCSVFESSLHILTASSDLCFANIFSQSVACLLTLLRISYTEKSL